VPLIMNPLIAGSRCIKLIEGCYWKFRRGIVKEVPFTVFSLQGRFSSLSSTVVNLSALPPYYPCQPCKVAIMEFNANHCPLG
jgi:hypothetical protein